MTKDVIIQTKAGQGAAGFQEKALTQRVKRRDLG
jgi:hypothetical protein